MSYVHLVKFVVAVDVTFTNAKILVKYCYAVEFQ